MASEVSLTRLYALRAGYLFIVTGLAATVWPSLIDHPPQWPLMTGVVCALLAAVSVLAAAGIRYPLQMLPVLFFELLWKSIWLIAVAWPLWSAGQIDTRTWQTVTDCLLAVILIPIIPWRYAVSQYVLKPGDRWRSTPQLRSTRARGNEPGVRHRAPASPPRNGDLTALVP